MARSTRKPDYSGYANRNAKPPETRKLFLKAYEGTFGNVSASCEYAGIQRITYYRWMKSKTLVNRKFQEKIKLLKPEEYLVDVAEAHLVEQIVKEKNPTAIMFTLRTKGRRRGYSEKDLPSELTPDEAVILDHIKRQISVRAQQKGVAYADEVRNYLDLFGSEIRTEIREVLASELVQ